MSRSRYLKEVFGRSPYPLASESVRPLSEIGSTGQEITIVGGRVMTLTSGVLILTSEGVVESLILSPGSFVTSTEFPVDEVIVPGDLIEVSIENRNVRSVRLLVPTKRESPFGFKKFNPLRAKRWQIFLGTVRKYFVSQGFTELRTPTLVNSPGLEPYLDVFKTELEIGSQKRKFFLPTSPEFHMKKSLTLGFEKCFEFKECFRNGELAPHHQPEFLMLEWYRAFKPLKSIMDDVSNLLICLQTDMDFKDTETFKVEILKMEDLWSEALGFKLRPSTSARELFALAREQSVETKESDSFDDLFMRLFIEKLEPVLKKKRSPAIVWHFPPSQSALARLTEDGWADRFELYWKGLELGNAFHELNDPIEQRQRFEEDQKEKACLGKEVVPIDEEFMEALEWGMPPSAGIALGLERLFMALLDIETINDVRLFPLRLKS